MADKVAKEDLYIGFTKARNKGDTVTEEEAKRFGWTDEQLESSKETKKSASESKKTENGESSSSGNGNGS